MGYGAGFFAPGISSPEVGEYLCIHTLLKSHAAVYHIYSQEFRPVQEGKVSMVADLDWFEPASDSDLDKEAAERKIQFNIGWDANAVYGSEGNYPQVMIDRIRERSMQQGYPKSRLPEFAPDEVEYIRGTFDFLALSSYTTSMAEWREDDDLASISWEGDTSVTTFKDDAWGDSASDWLKVVPWGMRNLLNWIDTTYNHPEIIIIKNGFSDYGEVDDQERINYYSEYLEAILDAKFVDGVNITAYTAWSFIDDFEWTSGYSEPFGLMQVDFEDPERPRIMKSSGEYFKKVIETRCVVDICED